MFVMHRIAYIQYSTSYSVLLRNLASQCQHVVPFEHKRTFVQKRVSSSTIQSPRSYVEAFVWSRALGISVTRTVFQRPWSCAGITENGMHLLAEWILPLLCTLPWNAVHMHRRGRMVETHTFCWPLLIGFSQSSSRVNRAVIRPNREVLEPCFH
jgi:hypothetical protein